MPTGDEFSRPVRGALLAATGGICAMTLAAAPVQAGSGDPPKKAKPTLSYFLPRTDLNVTINQRLVRCPKAGGDAEVETTITVTPERVADRKALVVLDAGSGVFAKRTVKLELNPDMTLAAFNSTAEGQGGPILKSIAKLAFKVAAGVASLAAGGAAPVTCTDEVTETFSSLSELNKQIKALETLIAEGKGNPATTALLSDWRARRTQMQQSVTLTTRARVTDVSAPVLLKAPDYARWFKPSDSTMQLSAALQPAGVPGQFGFRLSLTPDTGDGAVRKGEIKPYGSATSPHKDLVYRLPVGASVAVQPCAGPWDKTAGCAPLTTHAGEDASLEGRVALMQLSEDQFLPVGKGGLFGTRQAAAKFDAQGAPVMLEYGTASGAADAAGVVDTLGEGLDTLRDAETEALKRAIAKEEARKKLNELREAAADPE